MEHQRPKHENKLEFNKQRYSIYKPIAYAS